MTSMSASMSSMSEDTKPEKPKTALLPLNLYAKTLQDCVENFNQVNKKGTWIARLELKEYREVVFTLIDDAFTRNLLWTDRIVDVDGMLSKYFPNQTPEFYKEVIDFIEVMVIQELNNSNILTGPTWDFIMLSRLGNDLLVQNSGDYRIWDWMRVNGGSVKNKSVGRVYKPLLVSIPPIKEERPTGKVWEEATLIRLAFEKKNKDEG